MSNEKISIDVLIDAAESAKTVKELKKAMKDLKDAALDVGQGGEGFEKITKSIANAKDRIDDVNESVGSLDPGAKAGAFISLGQSIAGAFSVATGAVGLFGSKNEDVEKAILKVQSAIAILSGIQALADAKRDLGLVKGIALRGVESAQIAISTALESKNVIVRGLAAAAQWALNAAMNANPIGLLILGITALIAAFKIFSDTGADAKKQSEDLTASYNNQIETLKRLGDAAVQSAEFQSKVNKIRGVNAKEQLESDKKVLEQKLRNIDEERINNEKFIEDKKSLLNSLSDEEKVKALDEIASARKSNLELTKSFVDAKQQMSIATIQFYADEDKKRKEDAKKEKEDLDKKNKEQLDKSKQYNDQVKKDKETLQNQIEDLNILSINNLQKQEEDKAKLDYDRKIKEVEKLKGNGDLKAQAEIALQTDLSRQLNDITIKYSSDGSKTRLDAELIQLENEGKSTLSKRIEIIKLERDLIINSVKSTEEEKLKAKAEYSQKEKELLVDSLKELNDTIESNSAENKIKKLNEYQQQLDAIKKSRDEQLKVIDDAVKKEVEIASAKGLDPNKAKLDADKKYASDRLLIEQDTQKQIQKLDEETTAKKIANFQGEFNQYAQAAQGTLTAIGDIYNAKDAEDKAINDEKIASTTASNDVLIQQVSDKYDLEISQAKAAGINTEVLEKKKVIAVKQAEYEKALAIYNLKKQEEVQQKKAFERNKKLQIASALIAGAVGAVNALSAAPFFPMAIVGMALATITTVASIAKINATKFDGGAGSPPTPPSIPNIGNDIANGGQSASAKLNNTGVDFNTNVATTGEVLKKKQEEENKRKNDPLQVVILQSELKKANQTDVRIEQKNTF